MIAGTAVGAESPSHASPHPASGWPVGGVFLLAWFCMPWQRRGQILRANQRTRKAELSTITRATAGSRWGRECGRTGQTGRPAREPRLHAFCGGRMSWRRPRPAAGGHPAGKRSGRAARPPGVPVGGGFGGVACASPRRCSADVVGASISGLPCASSHPPVGGGRTRNHLPRTRRT